MEEKTEGTALHRSPRRLLKGLLFLMACSILLAVVIYTPIFTLQRVQLNGAVTLTPERIEQIGRIHIGEPLFRIETLTVAQNLMQDLRIESAVVRRRLPDTLEIDIEERRPIATVACDYGYLDFDRTGKALTGCQTMKSTATIPLISGVAVHDLYIGDDNTDETIAQVLDLLQRLDSDSLSQISEINVAHPKAVVAYTTSAVPIRLGTLDRLDVKAKLMQDFLADLKTNPHAVEYVDFSYEAPFIRFRGLSDASPVREDTEGKKRYE